MLTQATRAQASRRGVILLVEDEPALRRLLGELLRDEGYTVLQAADGAEAGDVLDDRRLLEEVCLLILDMNLPELDGIGVLRHLAERGWVLPIVAMSAATTTLQRARHHGVHQTITKPFDLDRFLETVHHACVAPA